MDSIEPRDERPPVPSPETPTDPKHGERGKLGMAILLWFLGVPGGIILLYLIFGH